MRFLVAIFVLMPLLVAAFGTLIVLLMVFDQGVPGGLVAALLIMAALTAILAYMAHRILRRPHLELSPGATAPNSVASLTVGLVVLQTSAMVVFAFAYHLGTFSLRNWLGTVCIILGLFSLSSGCWLLFLTRYRIRRREDLLLGKVEDLRAAVAAQYKATKILVPSSVLAVSVIVSSYYLFNGAHYFSLLDLWGVAFFILSGAAVYILDNFR